MTHRHERQRDRMEGGEGEMKNDKETRHMERERKKGGKKRGVKGEKDESDLGRWEGEKAIKRDERERCPSPCTKG